MTHTLLRAADAEDYPAIAAVMSAANPRRPIAPEILSASAAKTRAHPLGLHLAEWVVEQSGAVVGFAGAAQWAGSHHPDRYNVTLLVAPPFTGQGLGSSLAKATERHLQGRGARELLAGAYEDQPRSLAFLTRRGFGEVQREFHSVLQVDEFKPQAWTRQAQFPAGFRHVNLHDFIAERGNEEALLALLACFNGARADVPGPPVQPYSPEDLQTYVHHPTFFSEGIQLAVTDGGEVAGLSELWLDLSEAGRLNTGLTGTARAYRRRGLALALKLAGLRVARQRQASVVWTSNASTNAPMLAINLRLGFKPEPAYIQMRRGPL